VTAKEVLMSSTLTPLNDDTFASAIRESDRPVLVDFGAVWCPPCRALEPTLSALAAERADVTWAYVDVDESPKTAAAHGVRSMPTLVLFREGKPVGQLVGHCSRDKLLRWLDDTL
jgi:thioredoxin 1